MKRLRSRVVAATAALALASCAAVGPNFQSPSPPSTGGYTESPLPAQTEAGPGVGGGAQRFVSGGDLPAQWWTLFRDESLDRLIRAALADSPSLAAAQATLREANENLAAQAGALLFPTVDADVSATRQKFSGVSIGQPVGSTSIFNLFNASVKVSYLLDVFGGGRRELEGLKSLVDYQRFQLQGVHLALTANIVTSVVREGSLRAQIRTTREIIAALEKQLEVVQRRFQLGAVSRSDVLAQQTELAQTRATLPPVERDLAQTRHQLAVLAGRLPGEAALPAFELDALSLPQDLPLSLPSALARQRPDIRAAEALLHQASAQIGVATANLYPRITLSGSLGAQALQARNLFAGPAIWSLGAGLAQPLFHGGELTARRRAAIAAYDAAAAQYRQTVLQALQNVADTLRALDEDARTLKAQSDAESVARQALELAQRQFRLGAVSYLQLLNAQRAHQQARLALVQAQAARYADTAALFQSLGGGWWNREAQASAPTGSKTD